MSSHIAHRAPIFIPFYLPWDRPADYQRQTCMVLSRLHPVFCVAEHESCTLIEALTHLFVSNNAGFFVKRISQPKQGLLYWVRPIHILPFQRIRWIKSLNTALSIKLTYWWWQLKNKPEKSIENSQSNQYKNRQVKLHRPILWIFDPQFATCLKWFKDFLSVYDCVDYHRAGAPLELRELTAHWEQQLILQADVFSVNSHALYQAHQHIRLPDLLTVQGFAANEYQTPQQFEKKTTKNTTATPYIGFIGAINHRIDYRLLYQIVKKHPNWQFILQGTIESETLTDTSWVKQLRSLLKLPNCSHQPAVPRTQLLSILQNWSVGIIPYQSQQPFNHYCFPMKLFEYFFAGLPVVSTPILELKHYRQFVKIADSDIGFAQAIQDFINHPLSPKKRAAQRNQALAHRYEEKIQSIVDFINTHYNDG